MFSDTAIYSPEGKHHKVQFTYKGGSGDLVIQPPVELNDLMRHKITDNHGVVLNQITSSTFGTHYEYFSNPGLGSETQFEGASRVKEAAEMMIKYADATADLATYVRQEG